MRALSILLLALVLTGLCTGCYTEAPTRLPLAAELGLVPLSTPDKERGQTLFAEHCAACHGDSGRGEGWRVAELEGPRPRDFHDSKLVANMSPARAYLAITQGVPRTSMVAFELISEPDRWHMAFFVLSLGHSQQAANRGKEALATLLLAQPTLRKLSELSNKNIIDDLKSRKLDEATARQVLAFLRLEASFAADESVLAQARHDVDLAIGEYRTGYPSRAKAQLRAAHLNHLKSQLKVLRLRNSGLALAIELEVDAVRRLMQEGAALREIEARARTLFASLDSAELILSQELSAGVGIAQSASVALSYTFDGAICLFLLLVIGTRRGSDRRERKAVGLGILVGIVMAVAIWLGWSQLEGVFTGALRTSLSFVVSCVVGLGGIPLLIATVRYFRRPPQTRMNAAPSWLALVFALAAGILVRDALEIVPALATIASLSPAALLGFVSAGIAIICLVSLLVAMERRLAVSARTALLCITTITVSVVAAGSAARSAQELGLLESTPAGHLQSPWLALWPTGQGVFAQLCVATACLVAITVTTLLKHERSA